VILVQEVGPGAVHRRALVLEDRLVRPWPPQEAALHHPRATVIFKHDVIAVVQVQQGPHDRLRRPSLASTAPTIAPGSPSPSADDGMQKAALDEDRGPDAGFEIGD